MYTDNIQKQRLNKSLNSILVGVLLLVLVEPVYFNEVPLIDIIYDGLSFSIAICLIIAGLLIKPITRTRMWIILFFGSAFLITLFSSENTVRYMSANFASLAVCLLFDILLKRNPKALLDSFAALEVYVYINFITVILFPNGLYSTSLYTQNWFLGYKNIQIRTILPIVCMALLRTYWKYGKITKKVVLLLLCVILTLLLIDSATALVGFAAFLLLLLVFHGKKKAIPKIISLVNALCIVVIGFGGIVALEIQQFFSVLIEIVLNRKLTFTGRISIWQKSFEMFADKPLFGYGYLTDEEYTNFFGNKYATHPHNFFLYILLTGGIFLGIIVLYAILVANRQLRKTMNTVYSKIILFSLISFLIMGITESLTSTVLLYPMLVLGMNAGRISQLNLKSGND